MQPGLAQLELKPGQQIRLLPSLCGRGESTSSKILDRDSFFTKRWGRAGVSHRPFWHAEDIQSLGAWMLLECPGLAILECNVSAHHVSIHGLAWAQPLFSRYIMVCLSRM